MNQEEDSKGGDRDANYGVLNRKSGRIIDENIRTLRMADKCQEALMRSNLSEYQLPIVEIEYVVYHVYDNGFRQEVKRFSSKKEAEQYTIDHAEDYVDPRTPFHGTVEKEITEVDSE